MNETIPENQAPGTVPHQPIGDSEQFPAETAQEAERRGPDEEWIFWDGQIKAGMAFERRWRTEAADAERMYFGEDKDPLASGSDDKTDPNKVKEETALIHANIDVLKPLVFSETPQPVIRRRFRGDGKTDETEIMMVEAVQRLAEYLLETERFDDAMEVARDDWLIAGRGAARVHYRADVGTVESQDPATGQVVQTLRKTNERVYPSGNDWRGLILAPCDKWERCPWIAFETPMTRGHVAKRFGDEKAENVSYTRQGLVMGNHGIINDDAHEDRTDVTGDQTETGRKTTSPFDTVTVFEIWNKQSGEVIWWSPVYTDGVLDKIDDPLNLEHFWPMPKPLVATTRGQNMLPRPDIKYYEKRAKEVQKATEKLATILNTISVSGLFPGDMEAQVKKLLDGESQMIGVAAWLKLMEKGGTNGIIEWLPIDMLVAAANALIVMRDQAKNAMFEASGVSDVMRAQGDPNETATAQQIKGRYAGLRLSDRQKKIAIYSRDLLRLMIEIAVEHFDTELIADITSLDLPMTEAERMAMIAQQEQETQQYQYMQMLYQQMQQAAQSGQIQAPLFPEPEPPEHERIPETSWELVHARLKSDRGRKISISIETQSTILADEQADKEARIEFLSAFSTFVAELAPLAGSGQFDYKTVKELLLFGVRGFPKSRTLEALISSLPDEPQGEPPEDTQITVAKIKAQVDQTIEEMEQANNDKQREHERQMKGVELMKDAAEIAGGGNQPQLANAQ